MIVRSRLLVPSLLGLLLAACGDGDGPTDVVETDTQDSEVPQGVPTPVIRFENPNPTSADDLVLVVENEADGLEARVGWSVNGVNRAELTGARTVPADLTTKGERWEVSVFFLGDGQESERVTASVTIGNALPTATVTIGPDAPTTAVDLEAAILTEDADGDPVEVSIVWKRDGTATSFDGRTTIEAPNLKKGDVWRVEVTPNDGTADGDVASDEIEVVNSPPVVTAATIEPGDPDTTAELRAVVVRADPDGDTSFDDEITWYVDNVVVPTSNPSRLPASASRNLQAVFFEVRTSDGTSFSEVVRSPTITIRDTPPESNGTTISPESGDERTTFTCAGVGFYDLDGDTEAWRYTWSIDGVEIPGATSATLSGDAFERGDEVTCSAAPWDGHLAGPALTSAGVVIGNAPPFTGNVVLATVGGGTLQVGKSVGVTFDRTPDPDGDPVTYGVAWYVNDVKVAEGDELTTLSSGFTVANRVRADVTPRDPSAAGPTVASNPLTVANGKPVVTDVALAPLDVYTNTDLAASVTASDPDGQSLWVEYTWFVNDQVVRVQTSTYGATEKLPSTLFGRDDEILLTVVAKDGTTPAAARSNAFTVGPKVVRNSVPSLTSVSLTPAAPSESSTLTCTPNGFTDLDGDAPSYSYRWTVAGNVLLGVTGNQLTPASFKKGDVVSCSVTPGDGTDQGAPVPSLSVSIQNGAPSLQRATLSNTAPYVLDPPLTVTPIGATDPDNDTVRFEYRWLVDGVQRGTSATFAPSLAKPGQQITCEVTPFDGTLRGAPVVAGPAIVQNTPPSLDEVLVSPATPSVVDALTASVLSSDADGDTLVLGYVWTIDGVVVPGVSGATLAAGLARRDQSVVVTVHADDGHGGVADRSSAPLVIGNAPPSLAGAHIEPALIYEDTVVSCVPDGASDPDGDELTYVTEWYRGGARVSLQDTITGALFSHGDTLKCRLRPLDVDTSRPGAPVDSATVVVENTPPQLVSASLTDASPREATVLGVVAGSSSDLDGDTLSWIVRWEVDGVEVLTGPTLTGALFDKGQRIRALVAPFDGYDEGPPVATAEVVAVNTEPVIVAIDLTPGAPTVADTITAAVEATDADDDALDLTYQWIVDGLPVQDGPTATLAPSMFRQGSSVRVVVTAADDEVSTAPLTSATIVVGNSPPSITGVQVTPATADERTTLTCAGLGWSDPDGDPPGYQYRWYVNDVLRVGTATITGASFSRGDTVVCRVRPYDGKAFGTELSSTPIVVRNTPPSAVASRLSTATPRELDTVSVVLDGVADADGDALTRTYKWFVDGVQVSTAATLTGAAYDKGQRIRAEVVLSDGVDSVTYATSEVTAVNTAPVIGTLGIAPQVPRAVDDIVATATATDPDPGDTVTLTYAWSVGGVVLPSPTTNVLPSGAFRKHQEVFVTVTPADGTESGAPRTSGSVFPINTATTVASVVIEPGVVDRRVSPRCVATGVVDTDGDPIVMRYRWTRNGITVSSLDTLSPDRFSRGDTLRCYASGFDDEELGAEQVSQSVVVGNAPPTISLVQLVPDDPRIVDVIQANITSEDADGDIVSLRYVWRVNGSQVSVESRLDRTWFSRGDRVQLEVIPNDGITDGPSGFSDEVVIRNTAPSVTRAQLDPQEFRTNDTVGVVVDASDTEGDPITLSYRWFVDGAVVQSGPTATLSGAFFSKGQQVWVEVTGSDGTDASEPRVAPARTVLNSGPTAPVVKLTPTDPEPYYDDVTCGLQTASTDPDGDPITYEFAWYNDLGTQYPRTYSPTASVFSKSNTYDGMVLICAAQASDGSAISAWSPAVSVELSLKIYTSCDDWFHQGATTPGVYALDWDGRGGPQAPLDVQCDFDNNGGWTLVMRTTSNAHNFGQNTSTLVNSYVGFTSASGVFEPFRRVNDFVRIRIKQTVGAQAGNWRSFDSGPHGTKTLLGVLQGCRDEAAHPNDDAWWTGSSTTSHTDVYSGLSVNDGGTLTVYRDDGSSKIASHFFACGVNESLDNDVAYLSFSDDQGAYNTWGDAWRGSTQIGTVWSFANGNYTTGYGHIGNGTMEGFAGWKGVAGQASGNQHAGTYELWVQ